MYLFCRNKFEQVRGRRVTSSTQGAGEQEGGPHKIIPMAGRGFEYYQLCQHFHIGLFVLLNNNKTQIPVLHRLESFVFYSLTTHVLAQQWGCGGSFL